MTRNNKTESKKTMKIKLLQESQTEIKRKFTNQPKNSVVSDRKICSHFNCESGGISPLNSGDVPDFLNLHLGTSTCLRLFLGTQNQPQYIPSWASAPSQAPCVVESAFAAHVFNV